MSCHAAKAYYTYIRRDIYVTAKARNSICKKQCVKRKSIRCAMLFVLIMILLLCCGVNFLLALLLSGATVITIRILVLP